MRRRRAIRRNSPPNGIRDRRTPVQICRNAARGGDRAAGLLLFAWEREGTGEAPCKAEKINPLYKKASCFYRKDGGIRILNFTEKDI